MLPHFFRTLLGRGAKSYLYGRSSPKSRSNCCVAVLRRAAPTPAAASTARRQSSAISMPTAVRCVSSSRSATSTPT